MSSTTGERKTEPRRFYLDDPPVNLDLRQVTIPKLHQLLEDASRAASAGKKDEAAVDYRDATSGFSHLLSPTNEETIRAAYQYAIFYANCGEPDRADAVLEWMSGKHTAKWGPEHVNTYLHYARMVRLYHLWSRNERAGPLLHKIMNGLDDCRDHGLLHPRGQPSAGPRRLGASSSTDLTLHSPSTNDPDTISRQLDQVNIAIMANMTELDHVLEVIIEQCEGNSEQPFMPLQACRAKTALAKIQIHSGRVDEGRSTLRSAQKSSTPLITVGENPMSTATLNAAKQLAFAFQEAGDECAGRAVIDQVISSMEARRCIHSYDDEIEDALLFDFVQEVAFQFHEMESWKQCRYWAERGLGLAIRLCGYGSSRARRFEQMLKGDDFNMRTPATVDDIMSLSSCSLKARVVWTPR